MERPKILAAPENPWEKLRRYVFRGFQPIRIVSAQFRSPENSSFWRYPICGLCLSATVRPPALLRPRARGLLARGMHVCVYVGMTRTTTPRGAGAPAVHLPNPNFPGLQPSLAPPAGLFRDDQSARLTRHAPALQLPSCLFPGPATHAPQPAAARRKSRHEALLPIARPVSPQASSLFRPTPSTYSPHSRCLLAIGSRRRSCSGAWAVLRPGGVQGHDFPLCTSALRLGHRSASEIRKGDRAYRN